MLASKLNIEDIEQFTGGDCHHLAYAISQRTNYPICAFSVDGKPDLHAFVLLPDGHYLDANGLFSETELRRQWHCEDPIITVEFAQLQETFGCGSFCEFADERAQEITPLLLESTATFSSPHF
jgi:hypothetical protein